MKKTDKTAVLPGFMEKNTAAMEPMLYVLNTDRNFVVNFDTWAKQFLDLTFCQHSNATSDYSGLLRTSIGVPAESQIQELFCSSVKFDHKISISDDMKHYSEMTTSTY